jgi:type VI secretion system secreted protein Hcp
MDYYLKIDGLDGLSADDNHKGWIEVTSFQRGMTMPMTVQGKMRLGYLTFLRPSDSLSATLDEDAMAHTTFASATIECIKGGPKGKLVQAAKLSDVTISSVRPVLKPDGTPMMPAMEKVSLNFSKFEWTAPQGGYQMKYPSEGEACPQ